jgi:hypothetical protein
MAFNQTPGREKFPSTGNGLPTEFRQDNEPPVTSKVTPVTTTPKYAASVENYQNSLTTRNQNRNDIKVNLNTSEASPNEFKRNVKEEGGYTTITGSGGLVFRGRTGMKATNDAIKASQSKVNEVNTQRQNNSNFWDINAGVKPVSAFTEKDKETMLNLGKLKQG